MHFPRLIPSFLFLTLLALPAMAQQTPYSGSPQVLPGLIQAELYDAGGAGVAFNDLTPTNTGNSTLRGDAVDMSTDATASGNVTIVDAAVGEWLEYTVSPALTANRSFANLVLRYRANYEKQIRISQDGVALSSPILPATSGSTWGTVLMEKIAVSNTPGSVLRIEVIDSGGNALMGDKTAITTAEQWDVLDAGSTGNATDSVNLRNVMTGKFLRLTSKDHLIFAGGSNGTTTQERFVLAQPSGSANGTYSIRSRNAAPNNTFISIANTTSPAGAKATSDATNDQRFTLVDISATPGGTAGTYPIGRRVALLSLRTNRHLSIANDPNLRLDSLDIAQWVNRLPVIDPVYNRTIAWPTSSLSLTGVVQELDPSGTITSRGWTQVSGPSTATLGNATTTPNSPSAGKESTSVAVSALQRGIYVFRFSATDDMGDTSSREIEVAVIDAAQNTSVPANNPDLQYFGRILRSTPTAPVVGWSGAGVRFRVQSSGNGSITARLGAGAWPTSKQMFLVTLNGAESRIIDMNGSSTLSQMATNLPAGNHTIELYSLSGAWVAPTTINGFLLGTGVTLQMPPARSQRQIEFYGDSITEGGLMPDQPITHTYKAFAAQAARKLNAEAHIMARSGLGLVKTGFSGGSSLESLFNRTLPWDSGNLWSFNAFKPQVIVINILQNDKWQVGSSTDSEFITAYVRFLRLLRAQHPNAHIICALGSMDATDPATPRWPGIVTQAVNELRTNDRDGKLHTVFFPWLGPGTGHPSEIQAGAMADQLKAYIDGLPIDVWTDGREAPAGYLSWLSSQGLSIPHAAEAQPMADADGNGRSNVMDYAMGSSTTTVAPEIVPGPSDGITYSFPRAAADLLYRVEWSPTLIAGSWNPAPWPLQDLGGSRWGVVVPGPVTGNIFLRLIVAWD